jgi:hypothetical protein
MERWLSIQQSEMETHVMKIIDGKQIFYCTWSSIWMETIHYRLYNENKEIINSNIHLFVIHCRTYIWEILGTYKGGFRYHCNGMYSEQDQSFHFNIDELIKYILNFHYI